MESVEWPKISIVTPTFNQGKYIEETILSIISQNYPNLEYIIVDGGSTDNTLDIIKKYNNQIAYWVSEPDRGQTHALNKGFARCTGEIVAYINSDDYYEGGTFFKVASYFQNPSVDIINGGCASFKEGEKEVTVHKANFVTYKRLIKYWTDAIPAQPSVFFRRYVLEKVGYPDESLVYSMDVDMWMKMSKHFNFVRVNELFSYYRLHSTSKSGSEGAFKKFRPEWDSLSQRELKKQSFQFKISYYFSRGFYDFRAWFYGFRREIYKRYGISIGGVNSNNMGRSILHFLNNKI